MAAMQEVTLAGIVDVRGTVYGPGTITVPQDIATRLIKFHDAQPGKIITEDMADLLRVPAADLTPDQMQRVLDHKRGVQQNAAQAAPPQVPAQKQEGDPHSNDVVQRIMAQDINQIRQQLTEAGVQFPGNAGKKQLAELLAKSAGYQTAPPVTGQLPEKFPARDKLTQMGLDTIEKVRASKRDEQVTLTDDEKDLVAAELATS